MNRTRWIFAALIAAMAVAAIYVSSNPEMASRYGQAVRDSQLSTESKDLVMGGLVVLIAGYVGWFFFMRKD